jgi:hypothetical protein
MDKDLYDLPPEEEKNIPQVGVRLLKLCSEYDLNKISEQVQSYAEPLNARYIA